MFRALPLTALAVAFAAAEHTVHGQTAPAPLPAARVSGVVYDSIAMRGLPGALVQLALVPAPGTIAAVRSTVTDTAGRYDFDGVGQGTYLLGFQHVAVDSLGLHAPVHRLDVRTTSSVSVAMATPSLPSIIRTVCGRDGNRDSLAVLLGSVRHARSDTPVPGAFVSLRWGEVVLERGGRMQRSTPIVDAFANEEGWFTACVPGDVPVTVRATHDNELSGSVELTVAAFALVRRDIYVGAGDAQVRAVESGDSLSRTESRIVERGRGEARGVVRSLDGSPVVGARVALLNGADETRTNERGEFALTGLPFGTHTLEARAIGYVPGQLVVDIVEFRREPAELVLLDVSAFLLDTVRVAAARRLDIAARAGFERRKRSGAGVFIDESAIDSMRPIDVKDIFRGMPGIRFVRGTHPDDYWKEEVQMLGSHDRPCNPAIYIDGAQLLSSQADLEALLRAATVRRVEVYFRGIAIPAEFASNQACGVLAFWTSVRRPR